MSIKDAAALTDAELEDMIAAEARPGVDLNPANFVIDSREDSHGPYRAQAQFCQLLKTWFRRHKNWDALPGEQKESIEMICVKLSRIMSGNKPEPDHWLDISGYAMLVYNLLTTGDHRGQ